MTKRTSRPYLIYLLSALLGLTTPACDDILSFLEEDEENTEGGQEQKQEEDKSSGSETFTSQGGTLDLGGLKLVAPAGAFDSNAKVSIQKQAAGSLKGEYEASPVYKISLPASFTKALELNLKVDEQAGDGLLACVVTEGFIPSGQKSAKTPRLLAGKQEGDRYKLTVPAPEEAANQESWLLVCLVKDYAQPATRAHAQASTQPGAQTDAQPSTEADAQPATRAITGPNKFDISVPRYFLDKSEKVAQWCHEAYAILEEAGYHFNPRTDPIPVSVEFAHSMDSPGMFGCFVASKWGSRFNCIQLNGAKLDDEAEVKRTIIHELAHFSQYYFDPRSCWAKGTSGGPFLWMDEAVAVWTEGLYVKEGVSSVQQDNQWAPLTYFDTDFGNNTQAAQDHGYGMAGVLQWWAKDHGKASIVKLHQAQAAGAKNPREAFTQAFPNFFDLHFYDFQSDYVRQNGVGGTLLQTSSGSARILTAVDQEVKIEQSCGPQSVKVAKVNVHQEFKLPENAVLEIQLQHRADEAYAQAYSEVYRSAGDKVSFVGYFVGGTTFPDLAGLQKDKGTLYIVYYNTYLSTESQAAFSFCVKDNQSLFSKVEFEFTSFLGLELSLKNNTPATQGGTVSCTQKGNILDFNFKREEALLTEQLTLRIDTQAWKVISGKASQKKIHDFAYGDEVEGRETEWEMTFHDLQFPAWGITEEELSLSEGNYSSTRLSDLVSAFSFRYTWGPRQGGQLLPEGSLTYDLQRLLDEFDTREEFFLLDLKLLK